MADHYLFVPEHGPDDDVDYVLQHPVECVAGYDKTGPRFECGVQYELDNMGFDGLFDRDNRLLPGHWLIDAVHETIPGGPWGPTEYDMHWEVIELRKKVERMEEVETTAEPLADENQCGYPIGPRPADGLNTDNRFTVLLCVLPSDHLGDHLPAERWR